MKYFLFAVLLIVSIKHLAAQDRIVTDLSGKGWKLYYDNDSSWKNDDIFLPPVDISKLKVNPPSGGW